MIARRWPSLLIHLTTCFTLSSLMEVTHAAPHNNPVPTTHESVTPFGEELPHGVRSYLTKKAVQLVAAAFRHGGEVLSYVLKWVDDDAAKVIAKHGGKIGGALDDIAMIPGLTTGIVKEKLYYFLTDSLSVSGGVALQIADAVATTINWLLL